MAKSYSMKEATVIGRKEFNLSDEWHCFSLELTNKGDKLRYGLSPKDEDGNWQEKEVYGYLALT